MTVASSINVCSTIPGTNQPGADAVTDFIGRETTSKQFDEFCKSQPDYRLSHGNSDQKTALSVSFDHSNILLAIHIIKQGGKDIANQGDINRKPPLFWAITTYTHKPHQVLLIQKALLEAGADVNLRWEPLDGTEPPVTPLWQVLEHKSEYYATVYTSLTIMLLKRNAVIYPALTERGKNFLSHAQRVLNIINAKQKQISDLKELGSSPSCYFSVLPPELTKMAMNFLHPLNLPMEAFDHDEKLLILFADTVLRTKEALHINASDPVSLRHLRPNIHFLKERIADLDQLYEKMKSHHNPLYPEIFAPDAELIGQIGPELMMTLNGFKDVVDQLKKAMLAKPVKKELTTRDVFRERLIATTWKVLIYGILSFVLFISARALLILCRKKLANFNI